MTRNGRKNKRGVRGSIEDEDVLNEAKRVNMAANNETKTPDNAPPETSLAELKDMLADIQVKVTGIRHENLNLKEEIAQFKVAFQSQKQDLQRLKSTLEPSMNANLALKKELDVTKKKLKDEIEESKRLREELDDLEQYTRKKTRSKFMEFLRMRIPAPKK